MINPEVDKFLKDLPFIMLRFKQMEESASRIVGIVSRNPQYFPNIHLGDDCLKGIADWLQIYVESKNDG